MIFPGQTMGGNADGKQKRYISAFDDNPYGRYMNQMNAQPNQSQQQSNMSSSYSSSDGKPKNPNQGRNTPYGWNALGSGYGGEDDGYSEGDGGTEPTYNNQTDYKKAPTLDELLGMTPGEIGSIFGADVDNFTEEEFLKKYGMYLPAYDRTQENFRQREYDITGSGMRDEALAGKERIES